MYTNCKIIFITILLLTVCSCKKFLDPGNPPDKIVANSVYESNAAAAAVLTGIYFDLTQNGGFAQGGASFSIGCGLSADELTAFPTNFILSSFYSNNAIGDGFWGVLYKIIYRVNAAIEGASSSKALSPQIKEHLLGEAFFLRAFCYFYLVNLYGDIPLLITSDYKVNATAKRVNKTEIYNHIIEDLKNAKTLLSESYLGADLVSTVNERIRPNKWAATALMARVYLYTENWTLAEQEANSIIKSNTLYEILPLDEVFLKNSREAIWQLQPTSPTFLNTLDARLFILEQEPDEIEHPVWLSSFLVQSFEKNDNRRNQWIGVDSSSGTHYYYPFKYKRYKDADPQLEYLMVFRLAEQFFIRAEARAKLNDYANAIADLNVIRNRAGLISLNVIDFDKDSLLKAILQERKVELFTEWGQRWLDLKRTNTVNDVMKIITPQKGGIWETYKQLYPIPYDDLILNPNIKQNQGY